jgi:hypothetical protein
MKKIFATMPLAIVISLSAITCYNGINGIDAATNDMLTPKNNTCSYLNTSLSRNNNKKNCIMNEMFNFSELKSAFNLKKENVIKTFGKGASMNTSSNEVLSLDYKSRGLTFLLDKKNKQGVFSIKLKNTLVIGNCFITYGITETQLKEVIAYHKKTLLASNAQNPNPWIIEAGYEISFKFNTIDNEKSLSEIIINKGK